MRRLILLVIACLPAPALSADAAIRGRVLDQSTARPVEGALVTLTARDGRRLEVRTDARGEYAFRAIDEGLYDLAAESAGYQRALQPRLRAVERAATSVDFALLPAPADEPLEEIVVTASAIGADPLASVSALRLGREDIRRSPGTAGDVFRGLDILPGVASTGEFSQFAVRGNGQRDNLILVDGIPFDKVVHFAQSLGEQDEIGGGGRFSIFAPDIISSAEFQPGGWRAAHGGRNGSLLQLELAGGNRDSATTRLQLDVAGAEIGYEGPAGLREDTTIFVSARSLDFERLFEAIDNEDIGAPSLTDVVAKLVSEPSDRNRFELLAIHTTEDYLRDVGNVLASENFQDTSLTRASQDSSLLGLTWKWFPGERAQLRNALYARDSYKRSSAGEAFPDLVPPGTPEDRIPVRDDILGLSEAERELGWRIDFTDVRPSGDGFSLGARVARLELDFETRLAGDWIRYVYDRNDFRPDPATKYIVLTPQRIDSRYEEAVTEAAAYADYSWKRGSFTVTPGLRYEYQGFAGESLLSPRLSVNWQARTDLRAWAGGGVYYQTPGFLVLAADPANRELQSERSRQLAVGVQREFGGAAADGGRGTWRLSAEMYHQELDRLVVAPDRTDGRAANLGEGSNSGLELSLARRFASDWWGSASYSWLRAQRDDRLGEGEYDADQDRPHVFTIFGGWEPSPRWAFSAKWKYASGRPRDPYVVNADVLAPRGPLRYSKEYVANNTERFAAFHSLNVRVDYRRRLGPVGLVAFVDVVNVYGRPILDDSEWDERRGVDVEDGLEVFPTIGVRIDYVWNPG
jgi:hypothetical protein